MAQRFVPHSYPLFAVLLTRVDNPTRFELAEDEPRLVIGWLTDDDGGRIIPMLAGGALTPWEGPVLFEETRERAEAKVKVVERADHSTVRTDRVMKLFDRVEAGFDRIEKRFSS